MNCTLTRGQAVALTLDVVQPLLDLGPRERALLGEVDESVFLFVEVS
ncbi:hypothetical protein [Nostocoides vanveenii]